MVKKLKIFQAVEDLFLHPVQIYSGPIHRVNAEDFSLTKGNVSVKKKDEVVKRNALYYRSGFSFVNIERNCILPTQEEAYTYCNNVIKNRTPRIREFLTNQNVSPKDVSRFLAEVREDSSCIYCDNGEMKYSHTMQGKEFKKLMQQTSAKEKDKK